MTTRANSRGQTLVFTALFALLLTLAVFLTFSIGIRTREKIRMQTMADAAAYSNAVTEARAFNFYAWSNRAIVSHMVSVLSVAAHQSYVSWYEDNMAATMHTFYKIEADFAGGLCGGCGAAARIQARDKAHAIAHTYEFAGMGWLDPLYAEYDSDCLALGDPSGCRQYFIKGARYLHRTWHGKDEQNFCGQLVLASSSHRQRVSRMRGMQLAIDEDVLRHLTGVANAEGPLESRMQDSVNERHMATAISKVGSARPLAESLARLVDPQVSFSDGAGDVNFARYRSMVSNGVVSDPNNRFHLDYDEVLSGSRYPAWLYDRRFYEDKNWKDLRRLAEMKAGRAPSSDRVRIDAVAVGTAKMMSLAGREDPARYVRLDVVDPSWDPRLATVAGMGIIGRAAKVISNQAHESGHDRDAFGESDSFGAEDHGWVRSTYTIAGCGCSATATMEVKPGRNAVSGDPRDEGPRVPGQELSFHTFHGDQMPIWRHGLGAPDEERPHGGPYPKLNTVYRGHMRFRGLANGMLGQPRSIVHLTRPNQGLELRKPWDFDFTTELISRPVSFKTINTVADGQFGNRVGALSGAMAYFHKPPGNGNSYAEPPNFWNPFWRAKLHPVAARDARESLAADDPESLGAINAFESPARPLFH